MQVTLKCKWGTEKGSSKQLLKRNWDKWNSEGSTKKTKQHSRSALWFWKVLAVKDFNKRSLLNDDE